MNSWLIAQEMLLSIKRGLRQGKDTPQSQFQNSCCLADPYINAIKILQKNEQHRIVSSTQCCFCIGKI